MKKFVKTKRVDNNLTKKLKIIEQGEEKYRQNETGRLQFDKKLKNHRMRQAKYKLHICTVQLNQIFSNLKPLEVSKSL